jgi:plastocyanin
MKRWLALLLACLALGLVVAGCGGDDDEGGGGGEAETTEQPAEQPADEGGGGGGNADHADADAAATEVSMEGIKFTPSEVSVATGGTVTWTNNDTVGHDVTGDDFKSGDSGAMQNGDTFEFTFDKAGSFDYVCTVHPGMKGTVTVE